MDICGLHGPEMAYENEGCPACLEVETLERKIVAYESELAKFQEIL